jgi:ABC-type Zn uptake system ZnuABC Zn-binding protein ZnuA
MDPWTLEGQGNEYESRRLLRLDQFPSCRDDDPRLYMWLNPSVVLELTDELTTRLCTRDPANEKMFRANASAFRKKVLALCDKTRPTMDAAHGGFLSLDPGFVSLAKYFTLNETHLEPININDPSTYSVKVIRAAAKSSGARAIFVNNAMSGPLLREWENRLALTLLPLDATGSSAPGSGRSTYVEVLEYDLGQLVTGMKTPTTTATTGAATTQAIAK